MARNISKISKILMVGDLEVNVTKKKGIKNIYLKVKPPFGDIFVSCPLNCPDKSIVDFVLLKLNFVIKAKQNVLRNAEQFYTKFESGEKTISLRTSIQFVNCWYEEAYFDPVTRR